MSDLDLADRLRLNELVVEDIHEHYAVVELLECGELIEIYFGDNSGDIVDHYEDVDINVAHLLLVVGF